VLGADVLQRTRHLVEVALHQLLAQLVHQLVETLARFRRRELVLGELAHLAGQVGRQQVELHALLLGHLLGDLLAPLVARLPSLSLEVVDAAALLFDDFAQLARDVVVHTAQVVLLELIAPPAAQALHQLAQPGHSLAVLVAETGLHHAPQGRVQVTVVQQVVGDLREDVVGVELEPRLGAVPARVTEANWH